jgi:hypothetical protein
MAVAPPPVVVGDGGTGRPGAPVVDVDGEVVEEAVDSRPSLPRTAEEAEDKVDTDPGPDSCSSSAPSFAPRADEPPPIAQVLRHLELSAVG